MTDFYLKATDEAAMVSGLTAVGLLVNGSPVETHYDVVGQIVELPATETDPPVYADGWHVNLRTWTEAADAKVAALVSHGVEIVEPATPSRVWA